MNALSEELTLNYRDGGQYEQKYAMAKLKQNLKIKPQKKPAPRLHLSHLRKYFLLLIRYRQD